MSTLPTFSGRSISPEAAHVLRETHAARLSGDLGPDQYPDILARYFNQRSLCEWGVA